MRRGISIQPHLLIFGPTPDKSYVFGDVAFVGPTPDKSSVFGDVAFVIVTPTPDKHFIFFRACFIFFRACSPDKFPVFGSFLPDKPPFFSVVGSPGDGFVFHVGDGLFA